MAALRSMAAGRVCPKFTVFQFPSILIVFIITEGLRQWRLILLIGGLVGFVQIVALLFVPESPSSLVASGNIEQARKQLIKIRGTPDIEEELAGYQNQPVGKLLFVFSTIDTLAVRGYLC